MKKLQLYSKVAACVLALLFMGNMTWKVYGEEFSQNENMQADMFTDGTEMDDKMEPPVPDIPVSSGGYSYSGGKSAPRETVIRKPQLFLSSTSLDDSNIEAGAAVPFTAAFVNKSGKQNIYNLKITLSTDSGNLHFYPNSFYFSKVSPGQEIYINTTIKTGTDIAETTVPVTFNFEYEDVKGTTAAGTESRNFTVNQPIKMELSAGEIPSCLFAADTVEFTLGALNLSRTKAYNVRIYLMGKGLFPQEEIFIGNMEPGTKSEGAMRLYVGTRTMKEIGVDNGESDSEKYGPVKGKIILKYEDYQGNPGKITQKFRTEIKKPQILSLNVEEEEKEANSWWISVFTIGILGLISLVFILLWKLRRKNVLLEEARKEGFYEKT